MSDSEETRTPRGTKNTYAAIIIDGHRHENRGRDNLTDSEEEELKFADKGSQNHSPFLQSEVSL